MTGLDPACDEILEIATVVTDKHLEFIAEGPVFAIHQPSEVLEKMDDWNRKHHGQSGLIELVKNSIHTYADAEAATLAFLEKYVEAGMSPMCGNSICQDRRFLARLMPKLEQFFHYRNLDVSTLKELTHYWGGKFQSKQESRHRALDDVYASIQELRHYRSQMLSLGASK